MDNKEYLKGLSDSRDNLRDSLVDTENKLAALEAVVDGLKDERDFMQSMMTELNLGDKPQDAVKELREGAKLSASVLTAIQENDAVFAGLSTDKPAELIVELATQLSDANSKVLDSAIVTLIEKKIIAKAAQGLVTDHIQLLRKYGEISNVKMAEEAIDTYAGSDQFKELAAALVQKAAGGNLIVTETLEDDKSDMQAAGFRSYEESVAAAIGGGQ